LVGLISLGKLLGADIALFLYEKRFVTYVISFLLRFEYLCMHELFGNLFYMKKKNIKNVQYFTKHYTVIIKPSKKPYKMAVSLLSMPLNV